MKLKLRERVELVEMLEEHRARGTFSTALVMRTADRLQITDRYIWQLLHDPPTLDREPRGWRLTEEAIDLYYDHFGVVKHVYESLHERGHTPPISERQLRRAFRTQLDGDERWFASKGVRARRDHTGCLLWEASHRNHMWGMDFTHLKVRVVLPGPGNPTAVQVGLLRILDFCHRVVTGWMIVPTDSSDAVLEALYDAFRIDENSPFGGICELMLYDNGLAFLSAVVDEASGRLGFDTRAIQSYSPHLNGKTERSHQTMARRALPKLPSWSGGRRDKRGRVMDADQAVHFDVVVEQVAKEIHAGNHRPHAALGGQSPAQSWASDDTPLRVVDPEKLRFALRHRKVQTIQSAGVWKHGIYFHSPYTRSHVGEQTTVAWLLKDKTFVDLYTQTGEFIERASPNKDHSPEQIAAVMQERNARWRTQNERARRSKRRKARQFAATNVPGGFRSLDDAPPSAEQAPAPGLQVVSAPLSDLDPAHLNEPWSP